MTGDNIRGSLKRSGRSDAEVWDLFFAITMHGMVVSGKFLSDLKESTDLAADIADSMLENRNRRRPGA